MGMTLREAQILRAIGIIFPMQLVLSPNVAAHLSQALGGLRYVCHASASNRNVENQDQSHDRIQESIKKATVMAGL